MLLHGDYRDPVLLVLAILASWRITTFVCFEDGPWKVGTRVRRAAARLGFARAITCFHCTSVWLSVVVVVLTYRLDAGLVLLLPAVAGGASIAERLLTELDDGGAHDP